MGAENNGSGANGAGWSKTSHRECFGRTPEPRSNAHSGLLMSREFMHGNSSRSFYMIYGANDSGDTIA